MNCVNHPESEAASRCEACAEPCCKLCLVEVQGQQLCADCKVMLIRGRRAPKPKGGASKYCEESLFAIGLSIVGTMCCCIGIIVHPIALVLAYIAINKIKASPQLKGIEIARAAQIMSIVGLICIVLSTFFNVVLS